MRKLPSLSIFFPFFNDGGTVQKAVDLAFSLGTQLTDDLEVIAIHGGDSTDDTLHQIKLAKRAHPTLRVIDQTANKIGYAVIKYGFETARKDWVFYTDGDLQYDVAELKHLVLKQLSTGVDVVNGYKVNRGDNSARILLGRLYQQLAHSLFKLPIRDIDCDFRLIRRNCLKKTHLTTTHASILPELICQLAAQKCSFAEVPVSHFARSYGKSNYTWWKLSWEKLTGDTKLLFKIWSKQILGRNRS